MTRAGLHKGQVSAACLVHCGGRLGYIAGRADEIAEQVIDAAGRVPFPAHFSFGEQRCLDMRTNVHGNLLLSALVFGS